MIENIRISNYKSIKEMSFQPKRVNLFIGENGAGKSNILESLAIFSAATSNMLSNEFLSSRGIRPIDPLTTITKFSIDDEDNEDSNTKAEEKFSIFAQLNKFYIGVVAFHDKEDPYRQLKAEILTPRPDKEPASYVLSEESLTKKDSLLKNDLFKITALSIFSIICTRISPLAWDALLRMRFWIIRMVISLSTQEKTGLSFSN